MFLQSFLTKKVVQGGLEALGVDKKTAKQVGKVAGLVVAVGTADVLGGKTILIDEVIDNGCGG